MININTSKKTVVLLKSNIFIYIGFASLAIISSYNAPLTFDVPFPSILIFIFCIFIHFAINGNKIGKVSKISWLLILRLVIFFINSLVLAIDVETIFQQVLTTIMAIIFFEFFRYSKKDNLPLIKNIFLIFSLIISLQLLIGTLGNMFSDKNEIVSGIGNSNYAASFLLISITFLLFIKTVWYERIVLVLDILSLLITQSFGAYLALCCVLIVYVIKKFNWHLFRNWLMLILVAIILSALISIFIKTDIGKEVYDKIQVKISFLLAGDWQNFGSSRLELYEFSWNNIKRHLLFGAIVNYDSALDLSYRFQGFKTHNIILESLLLYGLVGTVINIVICVLLFHQISKSHFPAIFPYIMVLITTLIHGLIEPNLFTMHFDIFVWLIIGGLESTIKFNKKAEKKIKRKKTIKIRIANERNNFSGGERHKALSSHKGNK